MRQIILFLFLNTVSLFSFDLKELLITYKHTREIHTSTIYIKMNTVSNEIAVKTYQLIGKIEKKYNNARITISQDYFTSIYERLMHINYSEISNKIIDGFDGYTIEIKIGNTGNYLVREVWTPNYDFEKRGTKELMIVLLEIFTKIGLENHLN